MKKYNLDKRVEYDIIKYAKKIIFRKLFYSVHVQDVQTVKKATSTLL